jgi:hypothetical protein
MICKTYRSLLVTAQLMIRGVGSRGLHYWSGEPEKKRREKESLPEWVYDWVGAH